MRAPLEVQPLTDPLAGPWRDLRLVDETESTNADLVRVANAGSVPPWSVLVAEHQSAGRGRLGRSWSTTRGVALTFSALVPTPREPGWVPLLTGLAVADAVEELYAVRPALKWPNDVLAPEGSPDAGRKLAGILCALTGAGIVIGIGLNVDQEPAELPVETATSLRQLTGGHPVGLTRERLLLTVLAHLGQVVTAWARDPEPLRAAYRTSCASVGRTVRVDLGEDAVQEALAVAIDDSGRLVIEASGVRRPLAAGDVTHVR